MVGLPEAPWEVTHYSLTGFRDLCVRSALSVRRQVFAITASFSRLPRHFSRPIARICDAYVVAGVDLDQGITVRAVHRRRASSAHPDSGLDLLGVELPRWDEVRDLAERAATVSGLDYVGVDVVIDDELGLLVLELNGRPGLDIQLANLMGLRSVLRDRFGRH